MAGRVAAWAAAWAAAVAAVAHAHAHAHAPKLDPEFARVTCGSSIKLTHTSTGFKVRRDGRGAHATRRDERRRPLVRCAVSVST